MRNQRGAVIIIVALGLVVLLGMAALAVDLGYLHVTRNELQNISDSSSLAATRYIGHIYETIPYQEQATYDFSIRVSEIKQAAKDMGIANVAAGKNITINDSDILIGRWHSDTKTFEEITGPLVQPTAVKVIARRDTSSPEGSVSTFFANVFSRGTANVNALAVASLTAQSTVEPGNLIPIGISEEWFRNKDVFCNQPIRFYPTNTPEGCAGWNVFFGTKISDDGAACQGSGNANTACLRDRILEEWLNHPDTYKAPGAVTGDIFEFTGGNLGNSVFTAFFNLFNYMKTHDEDEDPNTWTAQVVVYKSPDCSNPSGSMEVVGFATATITGVWSPSDPLNPYTLAGNPPSWYIEAKVICDKVELSRGGGGEFGTYGSIPNLVK